MISLTVWRTQNTWVWQTDRQTDRQMDIGRQQLQRLRIAWHSRNTQNITYNSLKHSVSFRVTNRIDDSRAVNQKYSLHQRYILPDLLTHISQLLSVHRYMHHVAQQQRIPSWQQLIGNKIRSSKNVTNSSELASLACYETRTLLQLVSAGSSLLSVWQCQRRI